ncbi:MAG: response regulator [Acidobacteriota bacterium]|nr:MAG: response regulator [Acidobacteriota bacterium]
MPSVLIVDDDPVDQELARRCLGPLPETVLRFASSGEQALEEIVKDVPDLVVTDLRMPGIGGLELLERVNAEHPLVPVIVMTAKGSELIAVRALEAGAASYVPKIAAKSRLAETAQKVLELATARRSQLEVVSFLERNETHFELPNDPLLITPVAGFLQQNLERLGFGNDWLRTQIAMAIMEALSNAMIHGNLEIGSEPRQRSFDEYNALIEARRGESPYAERRVRCTAHESIASVEYEIRDEGPGFDAERLPDPTAPENLLEVSGRGILLMRSFMDRVEYTDSGSHVRMIRRNPNA